MPDKISIEPALESDLESIKDLLAELIAAVEDSEGFNPDIALANCRALMQEPNNHLLVARQGNRVLGFINFSLRKTLLHPAPSALIDELAVSEKQRHTGIGKLLIDAAISRCRSLGCCEVEVSTEKSNTRARRFYKSCGFDEDAVLLEIDL
jgi:ribosomal protein S18 acetylase RimI-like enzyme